jgi:hypothetical protein
MQHIVQGRGATLALWALVALGCAYGGGGRDDQADSGVGPTMDSGSTPGPDTGVPLVDSGSPGVDSGGSPGTDAGAPGVDAGGGSCSESPCRLAPPQCGCPAGQGCYLDSSSNRICGTPGPEVEGQACSGTTACQPGLLCISLDTSAFCARFCSTDADCVAGSGSLCILELNDGAGGSIPGVKLCTQACDPTALSASGCPSGTGCAIYEESDPPNRIFTGCRPAGTAGTGAPCVDTEDCATGHFCADPAGSGNECVRYCRLPGGSCGAGRICNAFSEPVVVGSVEYGFCY